MDKEIIDKILNYWFYQINENTILRKEELAVGRWFIKSEQTDAEIKEMFEGELEKAKKGEYDSWKDSLEGRLALVILFDQFSRNIYRDKLQAFESDQPALELCLLSIADGFDQKYKLYERSFIYMPLMHSEDIKIQEKSLDMFEKLVHQAEDNNVKNVEYYKYNLIYAERHYDVIRKYKRFPHRNAIFERESTAKEKEYLRQPGSGF